jgi:hypothetical protein
MALQTSPLKPEISENSQSLVPCYLTPASVGAKPLGKLSIANGWALIAFTSGSGRRVRFAEGRVHDGGGRYERSDSAFVAGDNEARGNQLDTVESSFIMTRVPTWNTRTKLKFVEKTTQEGRERTRWRHRFRKQQTTSRRNHDVGSLPASGDPRPHVVDYLHDTPDALRNCCLVSRSWIPRARTHLFADIRFHTVEDLESWKETFPDPSTSPMCYAKTLAIDCPSSDAEVGGWIRGFSRVVHLEVRSHSIFPGDSRPIPRILTRHQIPPHGSSTSLLPMCLSTSFFHSLFLRT